MAKGSNMCGLYILYGFTVISYTSLVSKDFHDKNKLCDMRSEHVSERKIDKIPKFVFIIV